MRAGKPALQGAHQGERNVLKPFPPPSTGRQQRGSCGKPAGRTYKQGGWRSRQGRNRDSLVGSSPTIPAASLVGVDGLGNMPSNRRAVPRQSGKTLPDRLLCAVICGDIHINGKTAPVDPAKQALTPGRIADSALARIKARLVRLETGGTRKLSTKCIQKRGVCTTYVFRQLPCG